MIALEHQEKVGLDHEPNERVEFESLLGMLFPASAGVLALISVFIDESGTHHPSPTLSVAGYAFESKQYQNFVTDWSEILHRFKLPYFHMVDCAHQRGIFKGWNAKDCDDVARRLISIIKIRMTFGVVCSVDESDFSELRDTGWKLDAYPMAVSWLVGAVVDWADEYKYHGRIGYVLESGHAQQSQANDMMQRLATRPDFKERSRYYFHTFSLKQTELGIGLQAADILAWEWNKDVINERNGRPRQRRKSLSSLLEKPHRGSHLGKEDFKRILEERDRSFLETSGEGFPS
jgi:hypothetical protein